MSTNVHVLTFEESIPETVTQHSLSRSLALHLLPGVFILALYVLGVPLVTRFGFPPIFAMVAIGIPAGLAVQVWHLLEVGRQQTGRRTLKGVLGYTTRLPLRQVLLLVPAFVVLAFVIDGLTSPLKMVLLDAMPWLPEWFELRDVTTLAAYSRPALVITFSLYLLLNGIAAPIVEEWYFRGYLMPRLSRFGRWTPVVETGLFTVYHFWQPYYWITQFLFFLPVVSAVHWKGSLRLGIAIHMSLNLLGGLMLAAMVLG